MTDNAQAIIDKILASEKITQEELDQKIEEKLNALGGLISKEGAAHIIANELDIIVSQTPSSELKLKDVVPAMKNITVLVKVIKKYDVRSFGAENQGKVGSLFVGDETGVSRITFWNEKTAYLEGINEGDVLEIQHAYSKENNGRIEIHMGNASHCIVNPEGKEVTIKQQERPVQPTKKLGEIMDNDTFVNISATIVQAYDPRFFESCPECNKRMKEENGSFFCAEHGNKTPVFNYVMNIFLDDGSANMRAALWKEQIQQLLGKTNEEVIALKDDADALEEAKTNLLGRIINARARVKLNEAYNTKELVLYEVNANPSPEGDTSAKSNSESTSTPEEKKDEPSKLNPEATSGNVSEESLGSDDSEDDSLPSIDDLEDL